MVRDLIKLPDRRRALVQLSRLSKKGRALAAVPVEKGRQIVRRMPPPVQVQLYKISRRTGRFAVEAFAGLMVVGAVLLMLAYGRINQGPISFAFLVPTLEEAINRELHDLEVKIDDAIVQKAADRRRVEFRLTNIRLVDPEGAVVAQAPLAAIGLSGSALLTGRIAPGSVDFIGPRLLLFYSSDHGLALRFSRAGGARDGAALRGSVPAESLEDLAAGSVIAVAPPPEAEGEGRIDLTRTVAQAMERARRGRTTSSYLTRFGVRDAVVVFDRDGLQNVIEVPDFAIDMQHRSRRSVLLGDAEIDSPAGPWRLRFQTEQSERDDRLTFSALVEDLVPSTLAGSFPTIKSLGAADMPVSAETSLHLSTTGGVLGADFRVRMAAGYLTMPWDPEIRMLIDEGDLTLRYQASEDRVEILPSTIQWGDSRATIAGEFVPMGGNSAQGRDWRFVLRADDAVLAAEGSALTPIRLDEWVAEGTYTPRTGHLTFDRYVMRSGKASISFAGTMIDAPASPALRLSGEISAMPINVLQQMWPKFLGAGARDWVRERVTAGFITGGTFEVDMAADGLAALLEGGDIDPADFAFNLGGTGLEMHFMPGMPPIQTGDAALTMRGRSMAMTVPQGWIIVPSGRKVGLSEGRFAIEDLRGKPQSGELTFEMAGRAPEVLELLDHEPLGYVQAVGLNPAEVGGRASGRFQIVMPMKRDLKFADVRLSGEAYLNEATAPLGFGDMRIQGGSIAFNVSERALDMRGDVLLNGVAATVSGQRIFHAPEERQPEFRISTVLDEAARAQLGLDINHVVRGPMPVIVAATRQGEGNASVRVQADLGQADLVLSNMGWRKRPGRAATLRFDVAEGANGATELQDFKLLGDDIAISGWVSLDADRRPTAFYFPDFSVNVISHLEISGRRGTSGVWDVRAHGPAYDGRQFFQSLFSAGQLADGGQGGDGGVADIDLTADIGAVVGYFDTTLQNVSVVMRRRNGRLSAFSARGAMQGGAVVAVELQGGAGGGPRMLLAESNDAGAAFRLIGFYPRIQGGEASLQVNLDGGGGASTMGTLWARDFVILGDRVVSEVISNAADDPITTFQGQHAARREPDRQRIVFHQLYVPFSVGGGRFVLHDSYINGPILGATLRGDVDFLRQRIDLGGTYVPLYGLNSALGQIPILGNLLVGRRGEGVLGMTFAIKGPTSNPNVLVNPVSMVAPGIFRQMFEFTGPQAMPGGDSDSRIGAATGRRQMQHSN